MRGKRKKQIRMGDIYRAIVTEKTSPLTHVESWSAWTTPVTNHLEVQYEGPENICLEYRWDTEKELREIIRTVNANLATLRSCERVSAYDLQ